MNKNYCIGGDVLSFFILYLKKKCAILVHIMVNTGWQHIKLNIEGSYFVALEALTKV